MILSDDGLIRIDDGLFPNVVTMIRIDDGLILSVAGNRFSIVEVMAGPWLSRMKILLPHYRKVPAHLARTTTLSPSRSCRLLAHKSELHQLL